MAARSTSLVVDAARTIFLDEGVALRAQESRKMVSAAAEGGKGSKSKKYTAESPNPQWSPGLQGAGAVQPCLQGHDIPVYPPIFGTKEEAVAAVKKFQDIVKQAFQKRGTTSIKFDMGRKVADPTEIGYRPAFGQGPPDPCAASRSPPRAPLDAPKFESGVRPCLR